jgi:hypothetical protein
MILNSAPGEASHIFPALRAFEMQQRSGYRHGTYGIKKALFIIECLFVVGIIGIANLKLT